MHIPVLLNEVIQFLNPKPGDFIIDGTVDGGGHGAEIFSRIIPNGRLLGIDLDANLIEVANAKISAKLKGKESNIKNNLFLVQGNYADLPKILQKNKLPKADGLLLDLGFSSEQIESGRGFSFMKNEPLIMTYAKESQSVYEILKSAPELELRNIIAKFGEEHFAGRIAKSIKEALRKESVKTTEELREVIEKSVPAGYRYGRIHPATRTFQALRIYANKELDNLGRVLEELPNILNPDGRAVVISFHSLEDRIVKNKFREMQKEGSLEIITKKPVQPSMEEIRYNPRSRSAKLRAATLLRNTKMYEKTKAKTKLAYS
jgi:16S rRNA (cytosine1402-N4)-methyltransferase